MVVDSHISGAKVCDMLLSVCCLFHAKSCRLSDREKGSVLLNSSVVM